MVALASSGMLLRAAPAAAQAAEPADDAEIPAAAEPAPSEAPPSAPTPAAPSEPSPPPPQPPSVEPAPTAAAHAPAPAAVEAEKPPEAPPAIDISGYLQGEYQSHQDSEDQLRQGGSVLNQNRFLVRRARVVLKREWQYASL